MEPRYIWSGTRRLRCGYTTGSCAAMAAGAATRMLLGGETPASARLVTPSGVAVDAQLEDIQRGDSPRPWVSCAVRKDAGDDVDATDGLLVYARVEDADSPGVHIDGADGIGRVTLPGLDQPPGAAAINSVPRAMIARQVQQACAEHGVEPAHKVLISAPQGQEAARKTFNAALGIQGGISILGTTGIVEPMSVSALKETTDRHIASLAARGCQSLILVPGNYGQDFVRTLPVLAPLFEAQDVPDTRDAPVVVFANYLGDALDSCARHAIEHVLLVSHAGKLVKVAAGVMDTHSRTADCRVEALCTHAALCGAPAELVRGLYACPTTDAACALLQEEGLLRPVMDSLMQAVRQHLERRVAGSFCIEALMFSKIFGELGRTPGVDRLAASVLEDFHRLHQLS